MKRPEKIHYSWFIMVAGALAFFCTCGLTINIFTVYQPLIGNAYGYSQTQITLFATMKAIGQLSVMPFIVKFYKRFSIRTGMTAGFLLGIAPFFMFALMPGYPTFIAGCLMLGASNSISGMIALSILMERWFIDDCTFAISFCCMGSSFATIGIPSLIVKLNEKMGLSGTFIVHGLFMILLAVICSLIIKNDPKEKGLEPYRNTKPPKEKGKATKEVKYKPINRKGIIYASFVMAALTGVIGGPGWSCVSLHVSKEGYSAEIMAITVTIMSTVMLCGKFLFGWLSEKITMRITTILYSLATTIGLFMFCFINYSPVFLYIAAALYGFGVGEIAIGVVAWVRDWFEEKDWDKYKQRYNMLYFVGSISFSLIPGIIADTTGRGYIPTYAIVGGFALMMFYLIILIYKEAGKIDNEQIQ